MSVRVKHVGSFRATDDQGQDYLLDIFQEFHHRGSAVIEGTRSIKTRDGKHVNRLDKGAYKLLSIIGPDIILRSDDPDAP